MLARITALLSRTDSHQHRPAADPGNGRRAGARATLVLGLIAVVLMAFRVSWNALSDVARAIGADPTAALLYPIVVDGLMALALIATLVLTGPDREFALRVLATYTIASLLLNYVHGLIPTLHTESTRLGRLTSWEPANWALVLLATSLPVGSIYFGSDLVAKVLHHKHEVADSAQSVSPQREESAGQRASEQAAPSVADRAEPVPEEPSESTSEKVDEAHTTGSTGADESPVTARPPRSTTMAKSTEAAPHETTGPRLTSTESATDRHRTDAEVLAEGRRLTADWSDDQLTAKRLRSELRIAQTRARTVRDQLRAERASRPEPGADEGFEGDPLGIHEDATTRQQRKPTAVPSSTT
ncbi:hypothetical protein SGL43_03267 [Streptomyces globisporus]|uniref:DUF2637 domain-containing protein n=1 Tax=Streptomyces globisporus TaxID=1908 RepID=A0ABN8V122_STRGL|nr:DUF2637 domain-containing protein [Streptomyces globisporus]CAH9416244.1 hypothetical protein SGL43_03267 [Streptomyces globisporus]